MTRRKTHEEYIVEAAKINPNIEVVEKYINAHTKILHRCRIDRYEWLVKPSNILNGKGCPKCNGGVKYGHEEYVRRVSTINSNIEVIGEYVNTATKILHKCLIDGYEWLVAPCNILKGVGCPKCYGNITKTHEKYVKEVSTINPNIEVIEKYINAKTNILHKCKIDGHEWLSCPTNILRGSGCPVCKFSHGEKNTEIYLIKHNVDYIPQYKFNDCKNKQMLSFDFYLPNYNLCIEYDGIQHYEPIKYFGGERKLKYIQQNDDIKTKYCNDNNIVLLRIKYDDNIEEVLDNVFKNINTI